MANNATETLIGAVVLAVAAGFIFYAGKTAGLSGDGSRYALNAEFNSLQGIGIGTDVRLAGVKIGSVTGIDLDRETYQARADLSVQKSVLVPEDSEARITSEGLLGGSFVEIVPGGSDLMLVEGEEILNTQSSVSLLNLLLKFAGDNVSE